MEEKIYFNPGDIATLRQDIPYKPHMLVVKKETMHIKPADRENKDEYFIGIRCRWFTMHGELQEAVFNTKDLIKVE